MITTSACHTNGEENPAKKHGPHTQAYIGHNNTTTNNKNNNTDITTATTTTSSFSNNNNINTTTGFFRGCGRSRSFIFGVAIISGLVFLLIICYSIWTFSIEAILPVIAESNHHNNNNQHHNQNNNNNNSVYNDNKNHHHHYNFKQQNNNSIYNVNKTHHHNNNHYHNHKHKHKQQNNSSYDNKKHHHNHQHNNSNYQDNNNNNSNNQHNNSDNIDGQHHNRDNHDENQDKQQQQQQQAINLPPPPPMLGNNVTGSWFSIYVEVTTTSSLRIENPYATGGRRKKKKKYRDRMNRRYDEWHHKRYGHHHTRSKDKDNGSSDTTTDMTDDSYNVEQTHDPEQTVETDKNGWGERDVKVDNKETLREGFKSQGHSSKQTLSSTSLTDLEDVRWLKCNGGDERRGEQDGTKVNVIDKGDGSEIERVNDTENQESRRFNQVERKDDKQAERQHKLNENLENPIDSAEGKNFLSGEYPKNVSYALHYGTDDKIFIQDGVDVDEMSGSSGDGVEGVNNFDINDSILIGNGEDDGRQKTYDENNNNDEDGVGVGDIKDDSEEAMTVVGHRDNGDYEKNVKEKGKKDKLRKAIYGHRKIRKRLYNRKRTKTTNIDGDGSGRMHSETTEYIEETPDNGRSDWKSELKRLLEENNSRGVARQTVESQQKRQRQYKDSCDQWIQCKYHSLRRYLKQLDNLPSCPCVYPNLLWKKQLWDKHSESYFTWEVAKSPADRSDILRPGAKFCIRSLLEPGMITLAVQHCCYDSKHQLITRGRAAGTPNLISPQISWELHKKVDILPWVLCKGDWLRYHQMVPPNNALKCEENPRDREFYNQIMELRNI